MYVITNDTNKKSLLCFAANGWSEEYTKILNENYKLHTAVVKINWSVWSEGFHIASYLRYTSSYKQALCKQLVFWWHQLEYAINNSYIYVTKQTIT